MGLWGMADSLESRSGIWNDGGLGLRDHELGTVTPKYLGPKSDENGNGCVS
jgi:hypothetical protein